MSKCIICHKEDDGVICSHCLAKGASNTGKAFKILGKSATTVVSIAAIPVLFIATKGKIKPK